LIGRRFHGPTPSTFTGENFMRMLVIGLVALLAAAPLQG